MGKEVLVEEAGDLIEAVEVVMKEDGAEVGPETDTKKEKMSLLTTALTRKK